MFLGGSHLTLGNSILLYCCYFCIKNSNNVLAWCLSIRIVATVFKYLLFDVVVFLFM